MPYRPKNPMEDDFMALTTGAEWREAHAAALAEDPEQAARRERWWWDLRAQQKAWERRWERRWQRDASLRGDVLAREWTAIRAAQACEIGSLSPYAVERLRQAIVRYDQSQTLPEGALEFALTHDAQRDLQLQEALGWLDIQGALDEQEGQP